MSASSSSHPPLPDSSGRSNALLARVVSDSTQAIVLCDSRDGAARTITYLNTAFEKLTGHDRADAIGRTLSLLLCPPGGQLEWEHVEAALSGRTPWRKTLPAARSDGTVFWADLHVYPILDDTIISHWVGVITDVTDNLELHDALRRSDSQYRLLAENIRDLITVHSVDGRCRYASPSSLSMLGYAPEELAGKPSLLALPPLERPLARQLLTGHATGQTESTLIHRLRRRDGSFLWVETVSKTHFSQGDLRPREIISVTRDITKRRQAQENLAAMHGLLETVYRAIPIGLCLIDGYGIIIRCNQAFAQAFGRDVDSVPGQPAENFLPAVALGRAAITQQTPVECECTDAHGNVFSAELTAVDLEPNPIAKRFIALNNLQERKKVEARLRETNQLESLGTLAGGIAHDFNNKLAIVLAYASLLRDAAGDPARIAYYADTIIEAGRRGADVVRQLQLFANTHDTAVAQVDLHELVDRTVTETCASWPREIEVRRSLTAANPVITADAFQLNLALRKLLDNAREAMTAGGTVTVSTAEIRQAVFGPSGLGEQKNFLRISVEDTGVGIDDATRARMFEPFYSRGKSPESAGVGLAVVYGIMRAHHGSIEVDSAPGRGTRVHLLFPRVEIGARQTTQLPFEFFGTTAERRSILLVEDEQDIGALWQELLPSEGWRVLWARDGNEALRLFHAHREEIALVFTDIGLPGVDGWQVAEGVRNEAPGMPLLFASGAFRRGDRDRKYQPPVAYLAKPYAPSQVLKTIRSLVPA